ncbi:zinc finger protein 239-like [Octopus sinensis]|uniref:Zinc finger protein 239-like n=1 Tax=Octopus sinensis TaxID=2607531 RepID=A0A6P7T5Q6_9MOLL|nr:zinc finger protein 239-like [Octopus sinensis]
MEDVNYLESCNKTPVFDSVGSVTQTCSGEEDLLDKMFMNQSSVEKEIPEYNCENCMKVFSSEHELFTHQEMHNKKKPYHCDICGKSFVYNSVLTNHKRIHTGEKQFHCEICGKPFINNSALVIHIRSHTGEKPYLCGVCGKCFVDSSNLTRHKRIHTGENPFHCEICGKSFINNSALDIHICSHTGEKPYLCEICVVVTQEKNHSTVKYGENSLFKIVVLYSTNENIFHCEVCSKSFVNNSDLKRHKKTHDGGKIFSRIILTRINIDLVSSVYLENQCRFKSVDMIFSLRQVQGKAQDHNTDLYVVSVDLTKDFHSMLAGFVQSISKT